MTADDYTKGQLASLMWRAASHISFPAMVAVGLCVRNRVKDGNWLPVIEEMYGAYDTKEARIIQGSPCTDARDPKFQDVLTAVDGIFDGTRVDRWTNGGTMWAEVERPLHKLFGTDRVATLAGLEIYK